MAILAYQVTGFAYQGSGLFAYQGSDSSPPVVDEVPSKGNWNKLPPKIRKIKRSDYVHQQEYAEAVRRAAEELAAARVPLSNVRNDGSVIGDDIIEEDDAILLAALTRILH